jgi:hypothetical protein
MAVCPILQGNDLSKLFTMIGTYQIKGVRGDSLSMTCSSGIEAMKQRSRAPAKGVCTFGSNACPLTCRLIFCCPNLKARLSTRGVPPTKDSSCMSNTSVWNPEGSFVSGGEDQMVKVINHARLHSPMASSQPTLLIGRLMWSRST